MSALLEQVKRFVGDVTLFSDSTLRLELARLLGLDWQGICVRSQHLKAGSFNQAHELSELEKLKAYVKGKEQRIVECKYIAMSPYAYAVGASLALIDKLTAALEAAERGERDAVAALDANWVQHQRVVAAESRAEALQARVAELEAQNAQAEQQLTAFGESTVRLLARAEAVESELSALRRRMEQMGIENDALRLAVEAARSLLAKHRGESPNG